MTSPTRYDTLDAMRGLAAVAVMLDHFTQHNGGLRLFPSSPLAVDLFFCLSGFVIAHAYQQRIADGLSLWGFLRLRLIRLYPAWLIGCALGVPALLGKIALGQTSLDPAQFLAVAVLNLLFLPFISGHRTVLLNSNVPGDIFPLNDPGWSLFFEYVANILFFLLLRRSRLPFWLWPGAAALWFFVAVKLVGESPGWGSGNFIGGFPRVCFGFLTGAVLYQWRDRLQLLPRQPSWALLAVLGLALAVPAFRLHTYYWFVMAVGFVPALVALGSRCVLAPGSAAQRWAHWAGALSYPLYCVHFPLLMLVSLGYVQAPAWALSAGVVASVGLALAVLRVEKPLGQWLARHLPP